MITAAALIGSTVCGACFNYTQNFGLWGPEIGGDSAVWARYALTQR